MHKIEELEQTVVQQRETITRLEADLERMDKTHAKKTAVQAEKISNLEARLQQRDLAAKDLVKNADIYKKNIADLQTENQSLCAKHDEDCKRLQAELQDRDNQIDSFRRNAQESVEEIAQITKTMLDVQEQLEAERIDQASERQQENKRTVALNRDLAQLQRREIQSRKAIKDMQSSTSWKITGPLRRVVRLFRG